METIDIEAIQQELQKHGLERIEPNDPLFMDHLARRLELQWYFENIKLLLENQQQEIGSANIEFLNTLRRSYSDWINEGASYLSEQLKISYDNKIPIFNEIQSVNNKKN